MSDKPSAGDLPFVTFGFDPLFKEEHHGRWLFLWAVQRKFRDFWFDLRKLQQRGADLNELVEWMTRAGVVDRWFVQVIVDTFTLYSELPSGAQLESYQCWFCYAPLHLRELRCPWFAPKFTNPLPNPSDGEMENADRFASRMRAEFEAQLKQYLRDWRALTGEKHTGLLRDAEWTALAFKGMTYTAIFDETNPCTQSNARDKVVAMAVDRFSQRIGLALPPRR